MNRIAAVAALLAAVLGGLLFALPLGAQTVEVTAEVDRTDLRMAEDVTLTITVLDRTASPPTLPYIDGLSLVERSISSSHTFENGRLQGKFQFIFRFTPTRTGTIVIGPVTVVLDNTEYQTDLITLYVEPAAIQPPALAPPNPVATVQPTRQASTSYFAEAEVDDYSPFVGEQITYTHRVFTPADNTFYNILVTRGLYDPPDFAGFWNPVEPEEREYTTTVNGRNYHVSETDTILFSILSGDVTIGRGTMSRFGPNRQATQSNQVDLNVRPLPLNEPPAFTGAVGKFTIDSAVNKVMTTVGDPITLRVTIVGEGNIEKLPGPLWPKLTGWRSFDGAGSDRTRVVNRRLVGSRSDELLIIPESPGSFDLPPVEYAYFDPDAEEYVTISTDPISVEVLPDPDAVDAAPSISDVDEAMDEEMAIADIRGIKPPPARIRARNGSLAASPTFWALWLLPVVGLLALAGRGVFERIRRDGDGVESGIEARQRALARLVALAPTTSTPDAAASALHGYLGALLGQSSTRLLTKDIVSRVRDLGASDETAHLLASTLAALDEARFAGDGSPDPAAALSSVAEVVLRISREVDA